MKTLRLSLTFVSAFLLLILILLSNLDSFFFPSLTPFLQFLLPESYRFHLSNKVQALQTYGRYLVPGQQF